MNIPIECAECKDKHIEDSVKAMTLHILESHPDQYTPYEAEVYADIWAEDAYEREDRVNESLSK